MANHHTQRTSRLRHVWALHQSREAAGPLAVSMRSVTRKHLSVVDGCARFAQVTVSESSPASDLTPILVLNDHEIEKRTEADENLVAAAVSGLKEAVAQMGWRGLPLRVTRIESSYVDMHPDAARQAAISATTSLIEGGT